MSQRKSAELAGYHEDRGFRLTKVPAVIERLNQLAEAQDDTGCGSHVWIQAQCIAIVWRMAQGGTTAAERKEAIIALTALAGLAKLNGTATDRKQASAARGKRATEDIDALLDALEPGFRARLEEFLDSM